MTLRPGRRTGTGRPEPCPDAGIRFGGQPVSLAVAIGLGATHQTGWTGLIADVIRRRHGAVTLTGDVVRGIAKEARP